MPAAPAVSADPSTRTRRRTTRTATRTACRSSACPQRLRTAMSTANVTLAANCELASPHERSRARSWMGRHGGPSSDVLMAGEVATTVLVRPADRCLCNRTRNPDDRPGGQSHGLMVARWRIRPTPSSSSCFLFSKNGPESRAPRTVVERGHTRLGSAVAKMSDVQLKKVAPDSRLLRPMRSDVMDTGRLIDCSSWGRVAPAAESYFRIASAGNAMAVCMQRAQQGDLKRTCITMDAHVVADRHDKAKGAPGGWSGPLLSVGQ